MGSELAQCRKCPESICIHPQLLKIELVCEKIYRVRTKRYLVKFHCEQDIKCETYKDLKNERRVGGNLAQSRKCPENIRPQLFKLELEFVIK